MIPSQNHPTWAMLVEGEKKHDSSRASASMLFSALQRDYERHPSKRAQQIEHARKFFEKCAHIMAADVQRPFGLRGVSIAR